MYTIGESIFVAVALGLVGLGVSVGGWLVVDPEVIEIIARGDMLLSISVVGSAFLLLGAISYLAFRINELIDAIRKQS